MMKTKKFLLLLITLFLIGNLSGYTLAKNTISEESTEYGDIPQTQLCIYHYFFDVDSLVYKNNHLYSSVHLNQTGKIYNQTNLFFQKYDITVSLINTDTEQEFAIFNKFEWNINEDIDIDISMDSNQIKDESVLLELNRQLERMKKNENHNIKYYIEISPQNNADNVMRTIGILSV